MNGFSWVVGFACAVKLFDCQADVMMQGWLAEARLACAVMVVLMAVVASSSGYTCGGCMLRLALSAGMLSTVFLAGLW